MLLGERLGRRDHGLVVGSQAVIDGAGQQHPAQAHEVRVHIGLARKSHLGRLLVGALAQPHPDALGQQLLHVRLRAVKVGLDHDSNRPAQLGLRMEPPHNVQRDLRQRRVLHVDAHKVARRGGMPGQALDNRLGQLR